MEDFEREDLWEQGQQALYQSWEVHRQAFGPILEPAFAENQQVRIPLIAALNHISRRQVKRGLEILQSIRDQCIYDADKAAWTFCVGLCFEMAGAREQMLHWYAEAGQYGHRFYLPYLKLAKAAHGEARFEAARKHYRMAMECLLEMEDTDTEILASACTNLTSCLTMMHRYAEAERTWKTARQFPQQPGAAATGAILFAAMGKAEETERYLGELAEKYPAWEMQTREMTRQILSGAHPHFSPAAVDAQRIAPFWDWFRENRRALEKEELQTLTEMKGQLRHIFPFLDREPGVSVSRQGGRSHMVFSDHYALGLHYGYGQLLTACPEDLQDCWSFSIVHE